MRQHEYMDMAWTRVCWCLPRIERYNADTYIFVHRRHAMWGIEP